LSKVPSLSYTRIIGALQVGEGRVVVRGIMWAGEGKVVYSRRLEHKSNKTMGVATLV